MKLKDCKYGLLVVDNDGRLGHIVGLTYTCGVQYTREVSQEELLNATIPLVQWPHKTYGIHHGNIEIYKG